MKILYGINGTGNGHIVKSINIINELKKRGVEVDILISGTNHQIDIPFEVKYKFHGVSFEYGKNGNIDYLKTALNLSPIRLIKDIRLDVKSYDKVVTDFEPISAWACKLSKKDCIGVSHQYAFLSDKSPRPKNKNYIGELVLNKLAPVTTAVGLHFEKYDDFILNSVIRGDLKMLNHSNGYYYTVYLPSYDTKTIIQILSKYSYKFEIFTKIDRPIFLENLSIYPNSKSGFINSFINSKGIITSAGFETPSEALFLKKKVMVIPIKGQYEQLCNAESLKKIGIFVSDDLSNIGSFFENSDPIDYKWEDPMFKIIYTIIN